MKWFLSGGIVVVLILLITGCDTFFDKGPSTQETKDIFLNYFQRNLPITWAGSLMGGELKEIEFIEINRGKSIKQSNGGSLPDSYAMTYEDCWPVTMQVKGVALANMIFTKENHPFEETGSFTLCKAHNGKWGIMGDKFQ